MGLHTETAEMAALALDGYDPGVAEALVGRGVTAARAAGLTAEEVLRHYLEWNGVVGYAERVAGILDGVRRMRASRGQPECHVVAYGSPAGGFRLHGPFPSERAALDWGEEMGEGGEWPMRVHPVTEGSCHGLYPWSDGVKP